MSTESATYITPLADKEFVRSAVNQVGAMLNLNFETLTDHRPLGALSPKTGESLDRTSAQIDPLIEGIL